MENQNRKKVTQTVYERFAQIYADEKLMQETGLTKEAVIEWLKAFNNTDMVE